MALCDDPMDDGDPSAQEPASSKSDRIMSSVFFVTTYEPQDRRNWSGIAWSMRSALVSQGFSVEDVGPLTEKPSWLSRQWQRYGVRRGERFWMEREASVARSYGREILRRIPKDAQGVIFSPSSLPIAKLRCRLPIVFWTDATFASLYGFYSSFSGACRRTVRSGHHLETSALRRADAALYSSTWAANSAVDAYGADPDKVHVVPFGANLTNLPDRREVLSRIRAATPKRIRFLSIGVEWERKGMDRCLAFVREMIRRGHECELTIVGCQPAPTVPRLPAWVRLIDYVDKNINGAEEVFRELYATADFFLLLARADCTPIVLSEALAFGIPCVCTAVGGVEDVVGTDGSSLIVPPGCPMGETAKLVEQYLPGSEAYERLALSAFRRYQARLSWSVTGAKLKDLFNTLS